MKSNNKKIPNVLKITVISLLSMIFVIAVVFVSMLLYAKSDNFGFNNISYKNSTVVVGCSCFSGYTVKSVTDDTEAVLGERMQPINGDLGEYVIEVYLQDAEESENFYEKYSPWTTYEIDGSDLKFMYVSDVSFHGVKIYIGSDIPMELDDIKVKGIEY